MLKSLYFWEVLEVTGSCVLAASVSLASAVHREGKQQVFKRAVSEAGASVMSVSGTAYGCVPNPGINPCLCLAK